MARHPRRPSGRGAPDRLPPPVEPPDTVVEIDLPDKSAVPTLRLDDLKAMDIQSLTQVAKDLGVPNASGLRKQELIYSILKAQAEQSGFVFSEGVLEVLSDGYGSVGCAPCTRRLLPGEDARAGRWTGSAKTECGLHT